MNRLPSDTITAKGTVSLSFLRKMLVNEAMFLVKFFILILIYGISVATFEEKNKIKLLKAKTFIKNYAYKNIYEK